MQLNSNLLDRIGGTVTKLFAPSQNRDAGNVVFENIMTLGAGKYSGIAGPPKNSRAGAFTMVQNPWVFGAFTSIVNDAAEVPLYIRKKIRGSKKADGNWEYDFQRIEEHQALDLILHPMPDAEADGTNFTNGDLFKRLSMFFLLSSGEFMWRINSRLFGSIPMEMQMLYPHCTEVTINRDTGLVSNYRNYEDSKNEIIDPWDVVHVKMPNPINFYRGLSQLIAADTPVETERESDSWLLNWFKNRALPEAYIQRESAPKKGEVERFKVSWDEEHQGGKNAGKLGVLWGGELKELGRTQRDMQFKELKEYNRDTILASLRTSKAGLGMMEDANRASVEAFEYSHAKRVVKPFLTTYCAQLTTEFLARFPNNEGCEICFDNAVPDDLVNKVTVWGGLLDRGVVSINRVRQEFGIEPEADPMADQLLVAMGKVPLSDLAEAKVDNGSEGIDDGEQDDGEQDNTDDIIVEDEA